MTTHAPTPIPPLREPEAELQALFSAISDVILVLDVDGRYVKIAPTSPSLLYRPAPELIGRRLHEVFDQDNADKFLGYIRRALAARETVQAEYSLQIEGREVWFAAAISPMDDRQVVMVARDISDRKRAEQGLRETLSLLNATFESTADGILVVDPDGRIVSFNRKFAELWRIPDSVLEAKDAAETRAFVLEQVKDPDTFLAKIDELYHRPEASSFDVLLFKDGRIYERYSQPQRIAGKTAGRVWVFRDVTDRRRAEQIQLATYKISEAAHAAGNLHDLFAAIHEIVGGLMPAKNFYIALYDPVAELLSFPYFVDEYDTDFPSKRMGKGLTEYVLRTGQALLATPELHQELEQRGEVELIGPPSIDWLRVPLQARGHDGARHRAGVGECRLGGAAAQRPGRAVPGLPAPPQGRHADRRGHRVATDHLRRPPGPPGARAGRHRPPPARGPAPAGPENGGGKPARRGQPPRLPQSPHPDPRLYTAPVPRHSTRRCPPRKPRGELECRPSASSCP